ncbi:MAG: hypothetical protein JO250_06450 [Armatimonadetes bacterium]|nr:hypothetical protein [Armatimonadota bacterium]
MALCLLLATAQMPLAPARPLASHSGGTRPPPAASRPVPKIPCCCRPGHCHMADCPGNPDYARTHPGLMACAACACGPVPHPLALLPDGGRRIRLLARPLLPVAPTPIGVPVVYPLPPAFALRARPTTPPEQPPRAC